MTRYKLATLLSLLVLVAPLVAVAQSAVPDLPDVLLPFAKGYWWVVPVWAMFALGLSYVDTFLKEDNGIKDSWPAWARILWDAVTANIFRSKSAPEPPDKDGA